MSLFSKKVRVRDVKRQFVDGAFVKFHTVLSREKNCSCSFCGKASVVYKLYHPLTEIGCFGDLHTSYGEIWICPHCKELLTQSLFCAETERDYDLPEGNFDQPCALYEVVSK